MLARDEYRLIFRLAKYPAPIQWSTLVRTLAMPGPRARAVRDSLLRMRILRTVVTRDQDAAGRYFRRRLYTLRDDVDVVREIRAWLAGPRTDPPPSAPPDVYIGPGRPPRMPHDRLAPDDDLLLEIVLRNPGIAWRELLRLARRKTDRMRRARQQLEDEGALVADCGRTITRDGRKYPKRILIPNEDHLRVRWARERYRIPYEGPPGPTVMPPAEPTSYDWRAELRGVLSRHAPARDLYDGATELDPEAPRESLVRRMP